MATKLTLRDRILCVLQSTPNCGLEQLVNACPDYTWDEVFLEVDKLSRSGEVRIEQQSRSEYILTVVPIVNPTLAVGSHDLSAR